MSKRFLLWSVVMAMALVGFIVIWSERHSDDMVISVLSGGLGAIIGSIGTIWLVRIAHVQLTGISTVKGRVAPHGQGQNTLSPCVG